MGKRLVPPTSDDLKDLVSRHRIRRQDVADGLGVSIHVVNRWCLPAGSAQATEIPAGYWELLLAKVGERPVAPIKTGTAPGPVIPPRVRGRGRASEVLRRYRAGETLEQIGEAMGFSRQRAHQLLHEALAEVEGG